MHALAGEEMLGLDESSAALDLISAIEKLALEPTLRRHDELMSKGDLNDDERAELQGAERRHPYGQAQGEPRSVRSQAARAIKSSPTMTLLARILRC